MVPEHIGRLHRLVIDRVVGLPYSERRLMMKVLPLPAHRLMRLGKQLNCLASAVAPFRATCYSALGGFERLFGRAIAARVEAARAIGEGSKRLNAKVDA